MRPAFLFLFLLAASFAIGNLTVSNAEAIINAELPCSQLTDNQLEGLGDYYMEQMHQGDSHKIMDKMMGGEGSDSLKQMHIKMAKKIYCDEEVSGTMGMMGSGMMGYGMMRGYESGTSITYYLYVALLAGLVILAFKQILKKGPRVAGEGPHIMGKGDKK